MSLDEVLLIYVKRIAVIVFVLLTYCLGSLSQVPGIAQSKKSSGDSPRLKTVYDKRNDETIVSVPLMSVREVPGTTEAMFPEGPRKLPSETLTMTAYFSYPGRTFVKPAQVMLGFLSLSEGETKYRGDNEVTVRVDKESLDLGMLRVADRSASTNIQNYWTETLEVAVKTPEFFRIANGRKITIHLGKTEFDLSGDHLKSLRALADKIGN